VSDSSDFATISSPPGPEGCVLALRLFGSGQAYFCDHPLLGFPTQQAYLLLCYLLLNARYPQPREQLAAVFWGDVSVDASRKNLSQTLWRLRHVLEAAGASLDDYLLVDRDYVSFVNSSPYWLDIEAFEKTVAGCQQLDGYNLTVEQASHLEEAVALYTGHLLEGIYEDWCLYERERLDLLYLESLAKLIAFHERNGTYQRGLFYGELALAHDNTREMIHQQMMRLHWLAGDRGAALAQYKYCAQVLRDELGLPPLEETTRLYQQMAHNQFYPKGQAAAPTGSGEPLQELAELMLRRLSLLEHNIQETSAELQHIEQMLNSLLLTLK
jgi:DNA-binding SARP family transcriptional activator